MVGWASLRMKTLQEDDLLDMAAAPAGELHPGRSMAFLGDVGKGL